MPKLCSRSGRFRVQREVDRENAPGARHVAHVNRSAIRFDAAPGDGKAEAEPAAIGPTLLERLEHGVGCAWRQAPAFVRDFDEDAARLRIRLQRDMAMRPGELECV